MTKLQFAKLIKTAMENAEFQPASLAEACGVSEQSIRVMSHSKRPSTPSILRAADVLRAVGCSVQIKLASGEVVDL